jgi:hypothetical protein
MKSQHIPKLAAIFPAVLVSLTHLMLSVRIGRYANVVFQHRFDSGQSPSGADAVVESIDKFLSVPIPAILLAAQPVYGLTSGWWVVTVANSVVWGVTIYASYILALSVLSKTVHH